MQRTVLYRIQLLAHAHNHTPLKLQFSRSTLVDQLPLDSQSQVILILSILKPCPYWQLYTPNSATVAQFGHSCRFRQLSPNSATHWTGLNRTGCKSSHPHGTSGRTPPVPI